MADRSVKVRLEAEVSGYVAKMRTAAKATQDFGRNASQYVDNHRKSINDLSNVAALGGAALTGLSVVAIKSASDFDSAMSSVAAATMAPQAELDLLRQAALDAGAETKYSATEAADAIEQLAKAGVSTSDILNGGLHGALNLAASDNLEVGEAAEIAASAMTQFGLSGKSVNHIADLLAAGAGKAQGSVHDLGEALSQGGLISAQFGLSIEETVGGLSAFASAGLIGSDAGTSFKTMLQALANPSKKAQQELDELGIKTYDAQGNFVGLAEFAGQLQTAMADLSPEARNAAMNIIFGADASRAAAVLYSEGEAGIRDWIAAVDDQGFAAEQAAIRMDNLKGDLEQLRGALETAFIGAGDGSQAPLRGVVQAVTEIVDVFNNLPPAAQSALGNGAGIAGVSLLAVGGLGKAFTAASDVKNAVQDLGIASKIAGNGLRTLTIASGVGLAVAALAFAVSEYSKNAEKAKARTDELAGTLDELSGAATAETTETIVSKLSEDLDKGDWEALDKIGVSQAELAQAILEGGAAYDEIKGKLDEYRLAAEADVAAGYNAEAAYGKAADSMSSLREQYQGATEETKRNAEATKEAGGAAGYTAEQQQVLDEALAETGVTLDGVVDDMSKFLDLLFQTGLATMSARDAEAAYQQSLSEIGDTVQGLTDKYGGMGEALNDARDDFDLTTEAGREANTAFQGLVTDGIDRVKASAEGGAGMPELQGQLRQTYDDLVLAAGQFGITGDAADQLARNVLGVPENVSIDTWMSDQAMLMAGQTKAQVDGLDGRVVTVTTRFVTIGSLPAVASGDVRRKQVGVAAYATGGYTGDGGLYEPAGIVHRGEWVTTKARTAQYRPVLEAIHRGTYPLPGYATGGGVGLRPMPYTPKSQLVQQAPAAAPYAPTFKIYGADPSQVVAVADAKAAHHVRAISTRHH